MFTKFKTHCLTIFGMCVCSFQGDPGVAGPKGDVGPRGMEGLFGADGQKVGQLVMFGCTPAISTKCNLD